MSEQSVITEVHGHVLAIGLNRVKKRNAFDLDMWSQLASAYGRLHVDSELRCGLLYAVGDHFTAGLDLSQWSAVFASGKMPDLAPDQCDPVGLEPSRQVGKPIVAAVQGICFTIGIELLLATDIRVAATDCRFGQIEVKRGIYPVCGATLRMVQEFGWGNAQRWLLTGDEFNADEAYRVGLAQETCEPGQQFEKAMAIAERIASAAPLGVYASLRSSRMLLERGQRSAMDSLLPDVAPIMSSEDAEEGVRSFVERREARFQGR